MEIWIYAWISVIALSLVVEFITSKLFSVWFAFGGTVALILAIVGLEWYIQLPSFIVVSAPLVSFARNYIMKKINQKRSLNSIDQNIGKTFMLLSPIKDGEWGTIQINDTVWSVETKDQTDIMAGTIVKLVEKVGDRYVVEIEG